MTSTARVAGYLSYRRPNILHYAPIRREHRRAHLRFHGRAAVLFFVSRSSHLSALSAQRKIRPAPAALVRYDVGVWEKPETAQKRDVDFYTEAGFDPAINKLHWFLCGFEGAALVRNADVFPDLPLAQRQIIADWWFSAMFARFKGWAADL